MASKAENLSKEELALEVIRRLKEEYPDADCTLDYDQAWKLLVSVRLAAQCTDARVNVVVEDLYRKYPDVEALAAAEPEEIEAIVKPCGLGRSKARDISACMRVLRDQYGGKVPMTFEELLALPGVGRKSANLIMGDVFGKPAIVTDTHCIRLVNRIGLVNQIKEQPGVLLVKGAVANLVNNQARGPHKAVETGIRLSGAPGCRESVPQFRGLNEIRL